MKIYIFSFYPRKNYNNICNNIFDTNIPSRGYQTKLKNYRNSKHPLEWRFQGGGGLRQKSPLCGEGGMDIFWNYHAQGY